MAALVWGGAARAESAGVPAVRLSEAGGKVPLGPYMEHRRVEDPSLTIDDVRGGLFERTETVPNYGFSTGTHWFRFTVVNDTTAAQERLIELAYPPLDEVTLFAPARDGGWTEQVAGDRVPFASRPIAHRHFVVPVALGPGATATYYVRLRGENSVQLPAYLWERDAFIEHDNVRQLAVGAFYGVMLAMICYNLFLFFTVRDRSYLTFVMFVVCYSWIAAMLDGTAMQVLWPGWPDFNAVAFPLSVATTGYFASNFARELLELRTSVPRVDAVLRWLGVAMIVPALLCFVAGYRVSILTALAFAAAVLLAMVTAGAMAMRQGVTQARFYLLAWAVFFGGTGLQILNKIGLLPVTAITDNAQQVGLVAEVLLFSIALADRINAIKADQERARQDALDAHREAAANLQAEVDKRTHELRTQATKLQELDEQKTRFFQNVSHELRTPLTLILTPLEQLASVTDDRRVQLATQNARRLLRLVNQLLEFQKLAAGKRELDLQVIDVSDVARRCGEYVQSTCEQRRILFRARVDVPAHLRPVARAEADALEKILFNFLSNALKFTPDGGTMEIVTQAGDGRVRVSVVDSGPGIPRDQHGQLFQVFSQLDNQADAAMPGTGLGLALARELAESMGGEVGVESTQGTGSTFWVELPMAEGDTEEIVDLSTDIGRPRSHPEITSLTLDGSGTIPDDVTPSAPNRGNDGASILVVDDLADMRTLLRDTLTVHGYRVRTAPSGFDALRAAQAEPPALVITDWMMPGMSGPELVQTMREQPELTGVPIVLLTARSDEESKFVATEKGADAFLGKPFNEVELMSTVTNLLRLKDSERQVRDLNRHLTENVLKRYLPATVVESILRGETSIDGPPEKYTATVLFADLVGFTEMTRKLRVAKMSRLLNDYLGEMCEAVFLHDGTVDKFIGDAVMAVFGAPVKLDPRVQVERAIAAAHSMQESLVRISREWERQGVGALHMRIGIHQGPLVMGNFGNERRSDFTAIGPTVNMASRLQSSCQPGEVLVSGEVYDYLPERAAEPAGEFELHGIGTVLLYRLVSTARATLRDMRIDGGASVE